jgi:hypothetical protein
MRRLCMERTYVESFHRDYSKLPANAEQNALLAS